MYDQYIPGNVLGFNYWDGCYFTGTSTSTTKIGVRETIGKNRYPYAWARATGCGVSSRKPPMHAALIKKLDCHSDQAWFYSRYCRFLCHAQGIALQMSSFVATGPPTCAMTNNITNFTTSIPFSFTDPESLTFSITENVSLMVAINLYGTPIKVINM